MDSMVQKLFNPKYGDVIFQHGVKRKIGDKLGNGWVCVGNEKADNGDYYCKLKYCKVPH